MVTLSVTPSRVARVLSRTAGLIVVGGWDPHRRSLMALIDQAAEFTPGHSSPDAESASLAAWDAVCVAIGDQYPEVWEQQPGRTSGDVTSALRAAAKAVRTT